MAVNTAGQGARPRPAYSNAQHAVESRRGGEPESGGRGGTPPSKGFLGGKGIPTSGGRADDRQGTVDHTHDQGSKRLYLGKAFENAQRPKFTRVKGNSEGTAEIMAKTESSTVKKAAASRLQSGKADAMESRRKASGVEYSGNIFRREGEAFGPQRADQRSKAKDHGEFQGFPARRVEKGPVKAHRNTG